MRAFKSVFCARIQALALPLAVLLLSAFATPALAWDDPFSAWSAGGYLQFLQINRPSDGRPPYGPLNSSGLGAGGYTWDGPQFRALDLSVSGPLGWNGFSAVLEAQVYLSAASLADLYVQWDNAWGQWRLGNIYLPFGVEQQTTKADVIGIQRSLIYGFENYGSTQPWGLQLMNQRGWGLRWDRSRDWGPLQGTASAAIQDFSGGSYQNALGGVARLGLSWIQGPCLLKAGYSSLLARAALLDPPADFAPLGAPQGAAQVPSTTLAGHHTVATWGPDAEASAGPLHASAELALQSLDGSVRGGGQVTAWLELAPGLRAMHVPPAWQSARLYGKWGQASSGFSDGVHLAGALYRATTYGLALPLGWEPAELRLEYLQVSSDDFGGVLPDGNIYQAELQFRL